jgi:ribokinase
LKSINRKPNITVVGACNIDLVSYVPRLPAAGETLHGSRFHMGFGGKGANQAVMAAKLGAQVTMITKLGSDVFGENTLKNFESLGISTKHVHFTEQAFSGVAPIAVDSSGQNSIIIVTGANDLLTPEDVAAAQPEIAAADVLVCQLEIPIEPNLAALRLARAAGVTTIFNPAPAKPELPEEVYRLSSVFCPNETETQLLTGRAIRSLEDAESAARVLLSRGPDSVILTLGDRGSMVVTQDQARHIPAKAVKALDSTGAGDAYVGSLAYLLGLGLPLLDAAQRAGSIASLSVLKSGTQSSFPSREEVKDLLD